MLIPGSNRRIFNVDSHIGIAITGSSADGRQIINRARDEAKDYLSFYDQKIIPSVLASRLGQYVHYFTLHGSLRPFGSSALIASYDEDTRKSELYMIEPSGLALRYYACSAGKGTQAAKTELEKLIVSSGENGISCRDAVKELTKM
jgi:20S proteasome subunit alpha 7